MKELVAFLLCALCGASARWYGCAPEEKQRIYFANHTSHLDAVVLWAALPPPVRVKTRPVAAKDYWAASHFRRWLAEKVFHGLLIERHKFSAHESPLHDLLDALDAGDSLILFPEGTRSSGLEPQAFKSGLFHLARDRPQVELVPVYLENLNRILPKGEVLPVPLISSVTIGAPIQIQEGETRDAFLERSRMAVWSLHLT